MKCSSSDPEFQQSRPGVKSINEANSDADACCLGNNFAILQCTTKQVDVCACDQSMRPLKDAPVASGATAWDDPASGGTRILIVDEALCRGTKLNHSFINPNQV